MILLLLSAGMVALMGWFLATEVPQEISQLHHEQALWERGVPATGGSFQGEVTTRRFIFRSFKLTVSYRDQLGVHHAGAVEFSSLGGSLDDAGDAEVRYDPNRPDDFVLSKALDLSGARWASIAFFGFMGPALVALFGWLAYRVLHDLRRTLACARDGAAVEVAIVGKPVTDQYGNATYKYRLARSGEQEKPHTAVLQRIGPVLVDGDPLRAVAVQSQADPLAVVLLRSDGYPFALPPDARDALLECAKGAKGRLEKRP